MRKIRQQPYMLREMYRLKLDLGIGRSRWQGRRTLSLPPPTPAPWMLKTWRLAERLFYNQGYKDPHGVGWEGRRNNQARTCALARDTEDEGDITGLGILPGESGVRDTYWAPELWGLTLRRQVSIAGLKTSGTYWRVVRNWDSTHEQRVHTIVYSWEQGGGSRLKLPRAVAGFPRVPQCAPQAAPALLALALFSTKEKSAVAKDSVHLQGMEPAYT